MQIMQVVLPSGESVWVSLGRDDTGDDGGIGSGAQDAGLRDHAEVVLQAGKLPGFTEAICGVVASVREALDQHRPDEFTVDFGIQITAKTGAALSIVAAAEGGAQIRVSATWRGDGIPSPGPQPEPGES